METRSRSSSSVFLIAFFIELATLLLNDPVGDAGDVLPCLLQHFFQLLHKGVNACQRSIVTFWSRKGNIFLSFSTSDGMISSAFLDEYEEKRESWCLRLALGVNMAVSWKSSWPWELRENWC